MVDAQSTEIKASVGKYYFSASGFVSPFASVVMTTEDTFMDSTVADENGNFSMQKILVNEGFSQFCLEAVDIKKNGNSYTCFKVPPATKDFEKNDIFLPPTVGLSGRKITPGSSIVASGYTMRRARAIINTQDGVLLEVLADQDGYYKTEIKDLAAGTYSLFATATYQSKNSEKPSRTFQIESLSWIAALIDLIKRYLLLILAIILIIILLIILLSKRGRNKIKKFLKRKRP